MSLLTCGCDPSAGVVSCPIHTSSRPIRSRRCTIREHRVQIRTMQKWMQHQQRLIEAHWSERAAQRAQIEDRDREIARLKGRTP